MTLTNDMPLSTRTDNTVDMYADNPVISATGKTVRSTTQIII